MRAFMQRGARLLPASIVAWPWWPLLLSFVPALWQCGELWRETPLSYDHAAHLFKAWHFWEEMLGSGRVRGWSHFWSFGFPSDELAPPGSEAWVCLFRALTFGQLSWTRTYALAFAALLLLKSLSAYLFTRSYLGRAAAVACAWIATLDPGGMLEGGWEWHTRWGVWPVTLAMCFALLSLERVERVLAGDPARAALLAGLWCAAAILTHHMALLVFAIALPILLLDHAFRPASLTPEAATRAILGVGLGFLLSAFFLLPFMARSAYTQDLGWLGEGLAETSRKLVELRTFQFLWAPVQGLSIVGAWLALRRRVPGALFLVVTWLALVLLASGVLIRDLHLDRVVAGLLKLEANRFLLVAKLFCLPLAGHAIIELARTVRAALRPGLSRHDVAALVLVGGLALALLAPGWPAFYATQIEKNVVGEHERRYWADFQKLFAWTRQERAASRDHYRIAYHMPKGDHLSTLAPVFDRTLMFKVGYTPVQIFDAFPMTAEDALLEKLSVKYVVSSSELRRPTLALMRRFGELWLYRFESYRADPFEVTGPGTAQLLEFSPERIRIRLKDTTAASRLTLHVARFERWRASYGEREVPITSVPALGIEYPWLMEVPARDGELVFAYVSRGVDWLGLTISLLALPLFAALVWLDGSRRWSAGALAFARRRARPLALCMLVITLALAVFVVRRASRHAPHLPRDSLFRRIKAAGELTLDGQPCTKTAPLSFQCGKQRLRADVVSSEVWGVHVCMTTPGHGELRLKVRRKLGSFVSGLYDPRKKGKGRIRFAIDGRELAAVATRPAVLSRQDLRLDTRSWRGKVATLEVTISGAALHCFDVGVVD
jgi:hypothetical protein